MYHLGQAWLARQWQRGLLLAPFVLVLLFVVLDAALPFRTTRQHGSLVYAADSSLLHAYLSPDDKWRFAIEPEAIPSPLEAVLLFKEDRYFYQHVGVNPLAIARALWQNIWRGERHSGASTISMQVVRLLEPRPRTLGNKLLEAFRALQLEWHLSKREILALYLTHAPYGGNIEGIRAAAQLYFNQPPDGLSISQLTLLSIIPNRPNSLQLGTDSPELRTARDAWLQRLHRAGKINAVAYESALSEPVHFKRQDLPRDAPHLARRLSNFGQSSVYTTLNPQVQAQAEKLTQDYVQRIQHLGISQAAVLVVRNADHAVQAYVGSANFWDSRTQGQVDGVQAVRSPGSTLKPLLYALAIDKGLITPKRALLDVPINLSGYSPENYDERYHGRVTAAYALGQSLNIPAVTLLDELGLPNMLNALSEAGFDQIDADRDKLGLSVILGGCGARLEELVTLFSAYASGGRLAPIRYMQDAPATQGKPFLSEGSTYLITQVLSNLQRPDLPNDFQLSSESPRIAWKTGTSYGRRDAWAIGYTPEYTIGVWLGNFDGRGSPALAGAQVATPLLFKLFDGLARRATSTSRWFTRPDGLATRNVCAITGLPVNDYCEDVVLDEYLPGVSTTQTCSHLKWVWTAPDQTYQYCPSCLPKDGNYIKVRYPDEPPPLLAYYRLQGVPFRQPPPYHPDCDCAAERHALRITLPTDGAEYFLDLEGKKRLALEAQTDNEARKLYWFVEDVFMGSSPPGESFFARPDTGWVRISCTDDLGRSHSVRVHVHAY